MRVSVGWRYLRWTVNISALLCLTVNNFCHLTDVWRKKEFFKNKLKSFYHGRHHGKPLRTLQNGNRKGWNTGSISHETRPRQGTKFYQAILHGWIFKRERWSAFYVLIGYPSGQDEPNLPIRDFPRSSRKNNSLIDRARSVKMARYWSRSILRCYWPRIRLGSHWKTHAKKKSVNNAYILTIPAWQIVVRKLYMANFYYDYRFLINKFIILLRML